eukprot:764277-Hanusia_phi.AAC.5
MDGNTATNRDFDLNTRTLRVGLAKLLTDLVHPLQLSYKHRSLSAISIMKVFTVAQSLSRTARSRSHGMPSDRPGPWHGAGPRRTLPPRDPKSALPWHFRYYGNSQRDNKRLGHTQVLNLKSAAGRAPGSRPAGHGTVPGVTAGRPSDRVSRNRQDRTVPRCTELARTPPCGTVSPIR